MKHLKRWLALAVSAALALTLLAGCHTGGGISSRLLLDLLAGELENVQVETDSTFDRALKAAVQKGGSDPSAVLDALVEELNISGGAVNFSISGIGNASAGRQSLNVVFQPGTSASTAANNAASGWLGVLRGLSGSGEYSGLVSAVQVEGGYILAISVTVEQPGNIGSDSDDTEPTPDPIPEGGYEVINKVYHVYNEEGLKTWAEAAQKDLSTSCTLERDITLPSVGENESNWTPIGTLGNGYTGTFDGNNCTIKGLKISSGNNVGPFGFIGEKGKVENLTLKDATVSGSQFVGGVAGVNNGTITNCKVEGGSVKGDFGNIGGVVGYNCGTIIGCYYTGSVSGSTSIGGVVGNNWDGKITACYATGSVSGSDSVVGGVVGGNNNGTITACYHAKGNVTGPKWAGGVVGNNADTVTTCYWSGTGPSYGIDNTFSNDNATPVDGTEGNTWADAANAMNTALDSTSCTWRYNENCGNTPPTLKQK